MSGKSLKVTNRRMFTPDGELREAYRDLEEAPAASAMATGAPASLPPAAQSEVSPEPPPAARSADPPPDEASKAADGPGFMDLVGLLAEPAMIYLRQVQGADPQTAAQNLELARLHIDLLAVLRTKTEGNLSPSEQAMLEDVTHQLRSGYIGLRS